MLTKIIRSILQLDEVDASIALVLARMEAAFDMADALPND